MAAQRMAQGLSVTKTKKTAAERIRMMVRELNSMNTEELLTATHELKDLRDAWQNAVDIASAAQAKEQSKVVPETNEELRLRGFAWRVVAAAKSVPSEGRFGDNKVFINHIWRAVEHTDWFRVMRYGEFQKHLLEANQKRLLDLSRADLVEAMNRDDVRESETSFGAATFHFVRIG